MLVMWPENAVSREVLGGIHIAVHDDYQTSWDKKRTSIDQGQQGHVVPTSYGPSNYAGMAEHILNAMNEPVPNTAGLRRWGTRFHSLPDVLEASS